MIRPLHRGAYEPATPTKSGAFSRSRPTGQAAPRLDASRIDRGDGFWFAIAAALIVIFFSGALVNWIVA